MAHDSLKTAKIGSLPTPKDFRAQATGTGSTTLESRYSGLNRAQRVANSCDPACAKMLPPSYPSPMAELCPPDENGGSSRSSSRVYDQQRFTHPSR